MINDMYHVLENQGSVADRSSAEDDKERKNQEKIIIFYSKLSVCEFLIGFNKFHHSWSQLVIFQWSVF